MNHVLSNKRNDSGTTRQIDIYVDNRTSYPSSALTVSPSPYPFSSSYSPKMIRTTARYSASSSRSLSATNNGSSAWECEWTMRSHSSYGSHSTGHRYYPDHPPSVSKMVIWGVSIAIRHPICTVQFADLDLIALPPSPTSPSSPTQVS